MPGRIFHNGISGRLSAFQAAAGALDPGSRCGCGCSTLILGKDAHQERRNLETGKLPYFFCFSNNEYTHLYSIITITDQRFQRFWQNRVFLIQLDYNPYKSTV